MNMMNNEQYEVNPQAESVSSGVAKAVLIISIILAIIMLIIGLFAIVGDELSGGCAMIGIAVVLFITGLISWALLKMIVNISRSLYNINDAIRSQKSNDSLYSEYNNNKPTEIAPLDNIQATTSFSMGQLVVVKEDESQFRINAVENSGKDALFYSEKFNRYFTEDEIEDFDAYWSSHK